MPLAAGVRNAAHLRLSVSLIPNNSKSHERFLIKFSENICAWPGNRLLNFGGGSDSKETLIFQRYRPEPTARGFSALRECFSSLILTFNNGPFYRNLSWAHVGGWASPLNVPLLLPGNSSGESLLSRVSAGLDDASVAELFDRPSEGSPARFGPPSVPADILSGGKMNKLRRVRPKLSLSAWSGNCETEFWGEKKRSCHPGRIPAVMANELRPNVDFSLEEKLLFDDIRHRRCSVCPF